MRAILLAGLVALASTPALAQSITLEVDQSQAIRLSTPITGVVVGNAGVADVIVHDSRLIFVLGKSVGETQVLAVDASGRTVFNGVVAVRAGSAPGLVTVQRGTAMSTMQCLDRCIAVAHPEATLEGTQTAIGAIQARNALTGGGS
jgi:Flp pilus assembly secretin CpaC